MRRLSVAAREFGVERRSTEKKSFVERPQFILSGFRSLAPAMYELVVGRSRGGETRHQAESGSVAHRSRYAREKFVVSKEVPMSGKFGGPMVLTF